jgi:glycosyltransferase involved in cell wall biosynthesis
MEGYHYSFVKNTASKPGSHHFWGIINPGLIEQLKKWQPDIVWVYGWSFWSHLQVMRYFKGKVPVWFRGDSTLLDKASGWNNWVKKQVLTQIYRWVDIAFYPGTHSKSYFLHYGLPISQLKWLPHAVDNARFATPQTNKVAQWKEQLQIPANARVVGFAGKLQPKKDPLLLLKAFMAINDSNAYLVFCGDGPLLEQLQTTAAGDARIKFLPFQNQSMMPSVYQMMDIFCLPSKGPGETWGLAVNEAMSAGAAVLVSNKVGSAIDLVNEQAIFTAGDANALQQKLQAFLQSQSLLLTHKKANSLTIRNWSFEKGLEQLHNCC